MAGLFDFLRDNPAITQGLLAGGFGAMAGRGSKLQAWGQGGLAGLQGYGNALNMQAQEQERALAAKRAGIQEQMLQMQLENAQRQQQGQKATQDYLTQALSPVQPIDANAVSGVMGPRPEALKPVGTTPGFNVGSALKAGVPVDSLGQIQQMLQKQQPKLETIAPGAKIGYYAPDGTFKEVASNPKPEDLNSLIVRGPDGKPQINQMAFDVKKALAAAGAPSMSVKVDNKMGEGVAKEIGPMAKESFDAARGANQQISTADSLIKSVESGKILTGPGATFRLRGLQIGQALGVTGTDATEVISNTRSAVQGLAQSTLAARKQLAGQGQVSDNEGRLLERAASGNIDDMTAGEIKQIAVVNKRLAQMQVQSHKAFVSKLKAKDSTAALADMFDIPDAGQVRTYNPATGKIE